MRQTATIAFLVFFPFALLSGSYAQGTPAIRVTALSSQYKTITGKYSGGFTTGQLANSVLNRNGFADAGGPLSFSYPGGIASDGKRLLLADRGNNRVLLWNSLPTANTPPDIVIGQKDFLGYDSGRGRDQMNWPVSVRTDGQRVIVADTNNDRVLIWNSFPTRHGQPADVVLQMNELRWPWGLWTDGTKLVVSSTGSSRLLVWNQFPAQDNQAFAFQLTGNGQLGTPRTITSDGKSLIVGDHNPRVPGQTVEVPGNFVWKTFPTANEQPIDFFLSDPLDKNFGWMQGAFANDGRLLMIGRRLHLWHAMISDANDNPDASTTNNFEGGDGTDLMIVNGKLFLSLYNGHRVLVWNTLPTNINQPPDFALGSPDVNTNPLIANYRMNNPVPATDGKSLWVSSDFDRKMYVWKTLPEESGAKPDFVYDLPAQIWDNDLYGERLALAGQNTIYIWNKLPRNGELPDLTFTNRVGTVQLQNLVGVAMDDKYFYLGDNRSIYVFEGIPNQNSTPKYTLDLPAGQRLQSNGTYLVAMSQQSANGGAFYFYRVSDLTAPPQQLRWPGKFNQPYDVLLPNGGFYVADMGFGRVQLWRRLEDALAGRNPDVLLGARELQDFTQETARDKLFRPGALAFDGTHLWVGEFKFSHRLMRFSIGGLRATSVSAASYQGAELAPESIASVFGENLATTIASASATPLPMTLDGTTATVTDSLGVEAAVPFFYVSPTQVNYQLPANLAAGEAMVRFTNRNGASSSSSVVVAPVAPGLFAANANGKGLAAGYVTRVRDTTQTNEPILRFDEASQQFVAVPIDLGAVEDTVVLVLFGTGWRSRSSLSNVQVTVGGVATAVEYAGLAPNYVGLDQINIRLPRSLLGRGAAEIALFVDGKAANLVQVQIQ